MTNFSMYKHIKLPNVDKYKILGLTFLKIKEAKKYRKVYLFGIRVSKKRIYDTQIVNCIPNNSDNDNVFRLGVKLKGGLGDILIGLNYLNILAKNFQNKDYMLDVYAHRNLSLLLSLMPTNNFINNVYVDDAISDNGSDFYDLFIVINRYPDIIRKRLEKIYNFSPNLIDFVHACEKFHLENKRFFDYLPVCDGESNYLSEILSKKRIQQPDIYNFFNLKENFSYELNIDERAVKKFDDLGLKKNTYITIHRGVDDRQTNESIKLWPFDFYGTLINLLKDEYPNIKIVQLGINFERCPEFNNVDINLVGKTSLEDIKVLLKNSLLHIDGEGGFVHLRHALNGGQSVVLFGPTSPAFYGYTENINLRGNGCPEPCEWIANNWQTFCCRGFCKTPCMYSLTPEYVFRNIKKSFEK